MVVSTKDNWDKQLDDYRNKQHDAYSRLNCQSGQNTGMSQHSVIPSRQRVETTKQINPRLREQNTQTERFLFRNTKKNHRLKKEKRSSWTSRNKQIPTINLVKQERPWKQYPQLPLSTLV